MHMPQMAVRCPLDELELPNQRRCEPPAVRHLLGRQPLPPTPAGRLRQVGEGASVDLQCAEALEQLRPRCRREAVPRTASVDQPVAVVVAEDDGVETIRADGVATDYELLPAVDPHLK